MPLTVDVARHGDVAVLGGLDSDAAREHLRRSLVAGTVFSDYRGRVVDLRAVAARDPRVQACPPAGAAGIASATTGVLRAAVTRGCHPVLTGQGPR